MKLSEKEEKLIIVLAEKGPLTGYTIHKKEGIMSNAHWERVKKAIGPSGLNLIFEIETDTTAKPYWLTGSGIVQALKLQAKSTLLEKHIKQVYNPDKAEVLMILTDIAKEEKIIPVFWDYIGRLQENMIKGESQILTLIDILSEMSQELKDTVTVLATSHEKLAPLVTKTMYEANKQLKEKMKAS
ncbi:MAG TPA: hypothetical protein VGB32_01760 [Candidatus Bathyarchaeia archaeon]